MDLFRTEGKMVILELNLARLHIRKYSKHSRYAWLNHSHSFVHI